MFQRTSDLSSLSGSEQNEMPRHQPYLGRLVTHPGAIQPTFDGGDSPIKNQVTHSEWSGEEDF